MFPGLLVVLINWKTYTDTIASIHSLKGCGLTNEQIIVVDNGSENESIDSIRNEFKGEIKVIPLSVNRGYGAGCNAGIEYFLSMEGLDWLLLLNTDTLFDPGFIGQLEIESRRIKADGLGPLILYQDEPEKIWFLGDHFVGNSLLTFNRYSTKNIAAAPSSTFPVDLISGCAMLLSRGLLEKVGKFDESLFMYGEEVDYQLRAIKNGFHFWAVPSAKMWHKVSHTAKDLGDEQTFYRIRNQCLIYRRYAKSGQKVLLLLFTFFRSLVVAMKTQHLRPALKGWKKGWFDTATMESKWKA